MTYKKISDLNYKKHQEVIWHNVTTCEKEVHFSILLKREKNILKCELNVMFSGILMHVNSN